MNRTHELLRLLSSRPWRLGLLLVAATFLAYQPVWHAGFIWDDDAHLTHNPCIVGPLGFKGIWTSSAAMYYPLVLTSFWAMHALWGLNPLPYHLVNVGVHVACAILLWGVLRRLNARGAWLGAALWALHPVQVESVAWITELKNTQSCFFYLLAILFFLQWRKPCLNLTAIESGRLSVSDSATFDNGSDRDFDTGSYSHPDSMAASPVPAPRPSPFSPQLGEWAYGLALLCAVFAILSKSSTVMLPVVLALCWWWMERQWRWGNLLRLAPFFLVSAVASGWTIWEQAYHSGALGGGWTQSLAQRLIVAGKAVWFYLGKLLWPHPLIFIYPRWTTDASRLVSYLPALAVALVGLALWLAIWRRRAADCGPQTPDHAATAGLQISDLASRSYALAPAFFFALCYFLVSLFPVLDFFNVYFFRYSFVGDHFQYLASIGPLALLGAGIASLLAPAPDAPSSVPHASASWKRDVLLLPALCFVVSAFCCLPILTWRQSGDYKDFETLWGKTLDRNPNAVIALTTLGAILPDEQADEAILLLRRALEIDPDFVEARIDLGRALVRKGRLDEAILHFRRAIEIEPGNPMAHSNLGNALLQQGKTDEAIPQIQEALKRQPGMPAACYGMGFALLRKGQANEAITWLRQALAARPDFAEAHSALANALVQTGQLDEALAHLAKAADLEPLSAKARHNLGLVLLQERQLADAISCFRKAIEIQPGFAKAHSDLGVALLQSGQVDDALAHLQKAAELDPTDAAAQYNFAIALLQKERSQEAAAHLQKAIELRPNFDEARKALEGLKR